MNWKQFKNPPKKYSPAPFWSWNWDLDKKELRRQIQEMADKGWGGFFMHARVGLITPYLSGQWFDRVKTCVQEAEKTGMQAWLYDEDKWPSGFAGGRVPEANPDFRMKALRIVSRGRVDPKTETVLKKITYRGRDYCICRHVSALDNPWFNGTCYTDMMNRRAVLAFLKMTLNRYEKTVGKYFGREIPGIFTDEPCYLYRRFNRPDYSLPWTDSLPAFFQKRKGYSLLANLEKLYLKIGNYRQVRHDFFETATLLFLESFSKTYFQACENAGLMLTGHYMAEDTLDMQVQWIGAAMPHYEYMHWPGIDKLCRHVEQTVTCKQVSSVADQLGKDRTFSEVFGCSGQHFDFRGRRWIHNWEAALGINFVNHHLSLYTMAGERKRDFPPNLFFQQPWWDYERGLSVYFARLNYMLTRGKRLVEILVLHPIASAWSVYDIMDKEKGKENPCKPYDRALKNLTDALLRARLDFHYGDEIIMERHGRVQGKRFKIGKFEYSCVIVPGSLTWQTKTFKLLKTFHENGGTLLFIGKVPTHIDMNERIDYRAQFPSARIYAKISAAIRFLKRRKDDYIHITDSRTGREADKIFVHERQLGKSKRLVFLTNTAQGKTIQGLVRIPHWGRMDRIVCETGNRHTLPAVRTGGGLSIRHIFYPGDYLMLLIDTAERPYLQKPVLRKMQCRVIPVTQWTGQPLDHNVLPVNTVDLTIGSKKVLRNAPVRRAWDNFFYKAKDGTPFSARYAFRVKALPPAKIFAAIETARHLESIKINGRPVRPGRQSWLDCNFNMIDVSDHVLKGRNYIEIAGKKINNVTGCNTHRRIRRDELPYRPVELETIHILGNFSVTPDKDNRFSIALPGSLIGNTLGNITASGYPFYPGRFRFSSTLELNCMPGKAVLAFTGVHVPCIEVYINNKKAGVLYWEPYRLDITGHIKAGHNMVDLLFPTDLFNLMGPSSIQIGLPAGTGPDLFRHPSISKGRPLLLKQGIGSVKLIYGA